ncbi:MAG: hypothetical protein MSH29_00075 [Tenericutes bacterium]|nr:hypothetical protein [Mycoplasmatota bacterium]
MLETEINHIAIKLEQINFDKDTKKMLNKFAKTYRMKVTYYYGYISKFDKLNVHTISLHKIIFSKYGYDLLVLHYDEYHKNNNLYLIPNEKEPFTICSMKKYVGEYFGMIYKMKCKRNNKQKYK